MGFIGAKGHLTLLRVNDLGNVFGPAEDCIQTEVVAKLAGHDMACGFVLRTDDPNLPARMAMLAVLREAMVHDLEVGLGVVLAEGKKNGELRRVELTR